MDSLGATPVRAGSGRLRRRWGRNNDRCIVLQFIEAAVGNNVRWIDAVNLGHTAVGNARLYTAHVSNIVLNHINE
jgi:hypothetical protein